MRALFISDKSLPSQGGSQVIFHNVYRHFPADSVAMLTRRYPDAAEFDASAGYPVHRVPFVDVPKVRMPLLWLTLAAAAPRLVRSFAPDQIHCGQSIETGTIGWWLKRRYGLPYVVHTFLEEIMVYRRGRLTRPLLKRVLTGADAVTTISEFSREQLLELGVQPERIHMLYPGVTPLQATEEAGAALRRKHRLEGRKVLITVGRLAPRKGHDRVIEALPRIAERVPEVTYLIVGPGSERERLERLAQTTGVADRVVFTGPVAHAETPAYYRASDVFVMANRELANGDVEGFGLVFLEANACGLPVIGGRSGGTSDAIRHGETGWLVDPNDTGELAEKITQLLSDSALARRFGEAGRERVERDFTWERSSAVVQRIAAELSRPRVSGAPSLASG